MGLPDRWAGARWSSSQASPAVRYAGAPAEGPPPGGAPTLAQHLPKHTLMSSTRPQDIENGLHHATALPVITSAALLAATWHPDPWPPLPAHPGAPAPFHQPVPLAQLSPPSWPLMFLLWAPAAKRQERFLTSPGYPFSPWLLPLPEDGELLEGGPGETGTGLGFTSMSPAPGLGQTLGRWVREERRTESGEPVSPLLFPP